MLLDIVSGVLDLLDAAACTDLSVVCVSADGVHHTYSFATLWKNAHRVASGLNRLGVERVALSLNADSDSLTTLLGGFLASVPVVSLPRPSRGQSLSAYQRLIDSICSAAVVSHVVLTGDLRSFADLVAQPVLLVDELLTGPLESAGQGESLFIQCSSGSTAHPKGVVLDLQRLEHNIRRIVDNTPLGDGRASVSWLPLSHDMGVVGMFLAPVAAAALRPRSGQVVVLEDPARFVSHPNSWLELCAEFKAALTTVANFGLTRATRYASRRGFSGDLSALEMCIVGAEMVQPRDLREFDACFSNAGLRPTALSPAYGMAEVGLAVSITPIDEIYRTIGVDRSALGEGLVHSGELELVETGPPLAGTHVVVDPVSGAKHGQLLVSSPSLAERYLSGPISTPHNTGDTGFVADDGWVVPTGRVDDVIVVNAVNYFAWDLDACTANEALRGGSGVSVSDHDGGFALVAEPVSGEDLDELARKLRQKIREEFGIVPSRVAFVAPGELPRTSSGKVQRTLAEQKLAAGEFTLQG